MMDEGRAMKPIDLELVLSRHRKALVLAAEQVVVKAAARTPEKSQLNRLVSVCGEATCAEEIVNYLRYQASRNSSSWTGSAEAVIARIEQPLQNVVASLAGFNDAVHDRAKVRAWRLYAVFLVRAFAYAGVIKKGHGRDNTRR
jgi:hypothetical protein